jgi:hypothetical protein
MGDSIFSSDHTDEIASRISSNLSTFSSGPHGSLIAFERKAPIRTFTSTNCCFSMSRAIHGSTTERLWIFGKAFELEKERKRAHTSWFGQIHRLRQKRHSHCSRAWIAALLAAQLAGVCLAGVWLPTLRIRSDPTARPRNCCGYGKMEELQGTTSEILILPTTHDEQLEP